MHADAPKLRSRRPTQTARPRIPEDERRPARIGEETSPARKSASCAATIARRSATALASLLLPACGVLIGIAPLEVSDDGGVDGGVDVVVPPVAEASVPFVDASSDDGATAIAPPRRPPEGTYVYSVTGNDRISGVLTFAATYGPTASATVTHVGADCFTLKITLRPNYDETMNLCVKGLDVVGDSGTRSQQFALNIGARTTTDCKPGDTYFTSAPSPNQMWTHACSGKNTDDRSGSSTFVTGGTYRYVGQEAIGIAGVDVPVMHFHQDRTVSGAQAGTTVADWYFGVGDGVLVRLSRNINLDYPSGLGNINYRETALMTLTKRPGLPGDAAADAR